MILICKWYHLRSYTNTQHNLRQTIIYINNSWRPLSGRLRNMFAFSRVNAQVRLVRQWLRPEKLKTGNDVRNKYAFQHKPLKSWRARTKHIITRSQKHCTFRLPKLACKFWMMMYSLPPRVPYSHFKKFKNSGET